MTDSIRPVTKEMEVKNEHQMTELVDVTKLAASSELGSKVVEAMRKVEEATRPARSLQNIDYQEFADKNERTNG